MSATWGPKVRPVPRLLTSLVCEDAAVSAGLGDGRVSLQRVFFDLYASHFPAGFERLVVANLWAGVEDGPEHSPAGRYQVTVRILGPDGVEVAQGQAELEAWPEPRTAAQLFYFPGLVLTGPGRYTVQVVLEGVVVHAYRLHVMRVRPSGGGDG